MDDSRALWSMWQSLLKEFQPEFTCGGWIRFADWTTGMVLCDEEHTVTQILTSMNMEARWRTLEAFVEYGSWNREAVERQLIRTIGAKRPEGRSQLGGQMYCCPCGDPAVQLPDQQGGY